MLCVFCNLFLFPLIASHVLRGEGATSIEGEKDICSNFKSNYLLLLSLALLFLFKYIFKKYCSVYGWILNSSQSIRGQRCHVTNAVGVRQV